MCGAVSDPVACVGSGWASGSPIDPESCNASKEEKAETEEGDSSSSSFLSRISRREGSLPREVSMGVSGVGALTSAAGDNGVLES